MPQNTEIPGGANPSCKHMWVAFHWLKIRCNYLHSQKFFEEGTSFQFTATQSRRFLHHAAQETCIDYLLIVFTSTVYKMSGCSIRGCIKMGRKTSHTLRGVV